ncbi:MAG: tRNA lysidine(34) synthetase TilS [bacterium]
MTKYSQKSLIAKVERAIVENKLIAKDDVVILGLSGGSDSVCLFEILSILRTKIGFNLLAAHFNHRLRGEESEIDQKFVEAICKTSGVRLILGQAQNENHLKTEESARNARYEFFQQAFMSNKANKFALAHHANDAAETFLMRLVRGGGLKGLSSIQIERDQYIRPLLFVEKNEISQFLFEYKIKYRDDSSNSDEDFLRNQFRHTIIPQLEKINPQLIKNISNLSNQISDDYQYLEVASQKLLADLMISEDSDRIILDREKWLSLHPSMKRMTLRRAIEKIGSLKNISSIHLDEAMKVIEKGEGNKHKILPNSSLFQSNN